MVTTNTTAPARPRPASRPSIGPVHAGRTVKTEISAVSPTVAPARARRRGAKMRSELRTGCWAAAASAMAARAWSGVGSWVLTSFPPKENQRAERHGNHGDRHEREGTFTCLWPKPPGGHAPRDQHRRPEQEDPNRQVEGGLTEGREGSLFSSLPRAKRSSREVDR